MHPATIVAMVAVTAALYQFCDLPLLFTTAAGICMAGLVTVRWLTGPYLVCAEGINWAWLGGGKKEEVLVLVTRWGEEIIGTVVVRVVKRERRGEVRAWTVGLRYRGRGVGRGLLEEAARAVWARGRRGMVFEAGHASRVFLSEGGGFVWDLADGFRGRFATRAASVFQRDVRSERG